MVLNLKERGCKRVFLRLDFLDDLMEDVKVGKVKNRYEDVCLYKMHMRSMNNKIIQLEKGE